MPTAEELEILGELVVESESHLDAIEPDLIELEKNPDGVDKELVNRVFRAIHSIKGGFGFFGIEPVQELTHAMESVLMRLREGEIGASPELVDAELLGVDKVRTMLADIEKAGEVDASEVYDKLAPYQAGASPPARSGKAEASPPPSEPSVEAGAKKARGASSRGKPASSSSQKSAGTQRRGGKSKPAAKKESASAKRRPANAAPVAPNEAGAAVASSKASGETGSPAGETPLSPAAGAEKPAASGGGGERGRSGSNDVLRVRVDLLNQLMNLAGELVLARNQAVQVLGRRMNESPAGEPILRSLDAASEQLRRNVVSAAGGAGREVEAVMERELGKLREQLSSSLGTRLSDLPGVGTALANVDAVTSDLQESIMQTRMQPIESVFGKFPRLIRELTRKTGREVELRLSGGEVELDKSIIEALSDPLTHLLRNAIDHGVERPEARELAGKARTGLVAIEAYHEGGQVNIEIRDDGGGINPEKLRAKAVERGIMSEQEAAGLDEREAVRLIFHPGFSTAEKVTDVSGRGVGMDVVRTNIEKLGGTVDVESALGVGTRVVLKLPLTLAIIPSLIVKACGRRFAVPQVSLEELVRIRAGGDETRRIEEVQGAEVLRLRGRLLPLVRLSTMLGLAAEQADGGTLRANHVLVLKVGGQRYGLVVDQLVDNEEIVVKPLPSFIKDIRLYAGATIMGDGKVAMILDVAGIAETAELRFCDTDQNTEDVDEKSARQLQTETQGLLLFTNHEREVFGVNLGMVQRIEKVARSEIRDVGGREFLAYDDHSLRLIRLHDHMPVKAPDHEAEHVFVIIPKLVPHPLGIVASSFRDVVHVKLSLDQENLSGCGVLGSTVLEGELVTLIDIYGLFEAAEPELYSGEALARAAVEARKILLAEDTPFFRELLKKYLDDIGARVDVAEDGERAWEKVSSAGARYDLLLTDIEMPGLDGLELAERVRASKTLAGLPIVALTANTSDALRERGREIGIDGWEIKLDKERLLETIRRVLAGEVAHV